MERGIMRLGCQVGVLAVSLVLAGNAGAQETKGCPAIAAPPAGFAHWGQGSPLPAAATAADAQRNVLPRGAARKLRLLPAATVRLAAPPERADTGTSKAGLAVFDVAEAGTYRVALGGPAWIEVVRGDKPVRSVGHGHGPECSGIRKIVDFPLTPGRYLLQLSASEAPEVTVMIAAASPAGDPTRP